MGWMDDTYAEAIAGRIPAGAKLRKDAKTQIVEAAPAQIIRQSSREPNKTERRFENEYLKPMLVSGQIDRYGEHESIRLKIANGVTYTGDWPTWKDGRLALWEIKGPKVWDDAIVKLKASARAYPEIDFYICQWKGGIWIIQPIQA
jgi:hypothetical protein